MRKASRSLTSLSTRVAIWASRSETSRSARNAAASPIGIWAIVAMFTPPTVTASETGLSRAPSHAGHGTSRMKPS